MADECSGPFTDYRDCPIHKPGSRDGRPVGSPPPEQADLTRMEIARLAIGRCTNCFRPHQRDSQRHWSDGRNVGPFCDECWAELAAAPSRRESHHSECINCLEPHDGHWLGNGSVGPFCAPCFGYASRREPSDLAARIREAIDDVVLVANSLHDVAMVGWSPAVNAQRWASDNETWLRAAIERVLALLAGADAPPPEEP